MTGRGVRAGLLGVLLGAVVALSGCAPAVQAGPPDPDGAVLAYQQAQSGSVLWFGSGKSDVLYVAVTVKGKDLRVNASGLCAVRGADILCTIPTLPAGHNFILPMTGSNLSAVALYKRASGVSYSLQASP